MEQLTMFLLWCTVTPGKKSETITPRFNNLFKKHDTKSLLNSHGRHIHTLLKKEGIGQYDRLMKCWKTIRNIKPIGQLKTITREELVTIPGIGPKTASFFIVHSRKWQEMAVLDVHILDWVREQYPLFKIPEQTPQDLNVYRQIEGLFLGRACQLNMSPADLDNHIWKQRSKSS